MPDSLWTPWLQISRENERRGFPVWVGRFLIFWKWEELTWRRRPDAMERVMSI